MKFLLHLVFVIGPILIAGVGLVFNAGVIGAFIGGFVAFLTDPVLLIVSAFIGFFLNRPIWLFFTLVSFGIALSIVIAQSNAELGARFDVQIVSIRTAACLFVGYLVNALRLIGARMAQPERRA